MLCYNCQKDIPVDQKVSFREDCPFCGFDAHVCRNCHFYDESSYNSCSEPVADRVTDKEKQNYCEYFQPHTLKNVSQNKTADAKQQLEDLFKKK